MADPQTRRAVSPEGVSAIVVTIIAVTASMTWLIRSVLVLIAIVLTWRLIWQTWKNPLVRAVSMLAAAAVIAAITWEPIWLEFTESYPDTSQWLLERISLRPYLEELVGAATRFIVFVNQWWVQLSLFAVAVILVVWGWRPFWNLRHRLLFRARRLVGEIVWVDQHQALEIIRQSGWARARSPRFSVLDSVASFGIIGDENSRYQQRLRRFRDFCLSALTNFEKDNPEYIRVTDGNKKYREDKVQEFIDEAYQEELYREFGALPNIKLDPEKTQ